MAKMGFQESFSKMDVYISADSTITGDLQTRSSLKIDGRIKGNIRATGNVHVGSDAVVEGNIAGGDVQVAGVVTGGVTASGGLLLFASAKLTGDIKAASMEVEKGANYKGHMMIGDYAKEEREVKEVRESEMPTAPLPITKVISSQKK